MTEHRKRSPIRALFIADDRPGHYNLAKGILAAIATRAPVTIRRLDVARARWLPSRLLALLLARGLSARTVLRLAYGLRPADLGDADIVVSAGGNTLAANISAARLLGVPNIFYGSLRRYRPNDVAIAFTSYEGQATHPHVVALLKPSSLDPDRFPPPQYDATKVMGLLLGGNSGEAQFADSDWTTLLELITALSRMHDTRWIVSNSRRTPAAASDAFAAAARESNGRIELIDVRTTGPGTLDRLFRQAGAVLVSADSSTMLSEAIWLQRPVLALSPSRLKLEPAERRYRQQLEDANLARTLAIATADPNGVMAALAEITPLVDNPSRRLCDMIAARIPSLFASS